MEGEQMGHFSQEAREEFVEAIQNEFRGFKTTKELKAFLKKFTKCDDTMPSMVRDDVYAMIERLYDEDVFAKIKHSECGYGNLAKRLIAVVDDLTVGKEA